MTFLFGILGGTALLMYGVDMMGEGLERMSGKIMKNFLQKITGRLWKAFTSGIILTALVQSSTAISVLSVGFVNSGILTLSQAVGIIYGANIGTTITGQFMAASLTFDLLQFSLPVIALGFILKEFITFSNSKNIGHALMGIGFLLLGLKLLNEGIPFIQDNESVKVFIEKYASNLFVGILIGTVTTALVHSSAATLGIVILLGGAGLISLEASIILMLGENIGTSVTAVLASVHGNINAKRTAAGHALHNVIGVLMAIPFIGPFTGFIEYFTLQIQGTTSITAQIANSHTVFNVAVALAFLPFHDYFIKLLEFLVKDKKADGKYRASFLDPLLIATPIVAFDASSRELKKALEKQISIMRKTFKLIKEDNIMEEEAILKQEKKIIAFQKELTSYMISLSKQTLTREQSIMIPGMIKGAKYLERMGDLLSHLMEIQNERNELGPCFTEEANIELDSLESTLSELAILSLHQLEAADFSALQNSKELAQKLSSDVFAYSTTHIQRLEKGDCSVEASLLYLEILSSAERIGNYLDKLVSLGIYELQGISSPNPNSKPKA